MAEQVELDRPKTGADKLKTVNPATGQPGKSYDPHTIDDAKAAAKAARAAFLKWRRTSLEERSRILHKAAAVLRTREAEFARLMTEEMGKTLDDGRAEVEKCAFHCDWFADHAAEYLANEPADIGGGDLGEQRMALGMILAGISQPIPGIFEGVGFGLRPYRSGCQQQGGQKRASWAHDVSPFFLTRSKKGEAGKQAGKCQAARGALPLIRAPRSNSPGAARNTARPARRPVPVIARCAKIDAARMGGAKRSFHSRT